MSMNFDRARFNMIQQQVRPWDVLDADILALLGAVQREDFVPVRYRKLAFADMRIPLSHGEVMMKPVTEGRMLQALAVQADESVLEIGTGSGYITQCLSMQAKQVVSVDIHADFAAEAKVKLGNAGATNVEVLVGDVMDGWQPEQAHDVVVVTGSVSSVPEHILGWVNPGGRLFAITGESPAMEAGLMRRLDATEWKHESLFETDLPRLVHAEAPAAFEF